MIGIFGDVSCDFANFVIDVEAGLNGGENDEVGADLVGDVENGRSSVHDRRMLLEGELFGVFFEGEGYAERLHGLFCATGGAFDGICELSFVWRKSLIIAVSVASVPIGDGRDDFDIGAVVAHGEGDGPGEELRRERGIEESDENFFVASVMGGVFHEVEREARVGDESCGHTADDASRMRFCAVSASVHDVGVDFGGAMENGFCHGIAGEIDFEFHVFSGFAHRVAQEFGASFFDPGAKFTENLDFVSAQRGVGEEYFSHASRDLA